MITTFLLAQRKAAYSFSVKSVRRICLTNGALISPYNGFRRPSFVGNKVRFSSLSALDISHEGESQEGENESSASKLRQRAFDEWIVAKPAELGSQGRDAKETNKPRATASFEDMVLDGYEDNGVAFDFDDLDEFPIQYQTNFTDEENYQTNAPKVLSMEREDNREAPPLANFVAAQSTRVDTAQLASIRNDSADESPRVSTAPSYNDPVNRNKNEIMELASHGNGVTTNVDTLKARLQFLEAEICKENNGEPFNINSPKQVSQVLFGSANGRQQKTDKETLSAMGTRMADLILQWRKCSRDIKRSETKQSQQTKTVTNVFDQRTEKTQDSLLLVDASAYIFRAYYSMPPLHRSDGMPVGAVLGFCNMLNRLILHRLLEGECPRLVLVFDAKGKTFRHDLYSAYKANRKECPMDLVPQFDLIRNVADAYGIQQIEANTYEADDVIATLATMAFDDGISVNILSGDKDLMQLVTPEDVIPSVNMIDPMKMKRITHDVVVEKWGVPPEKVGDILALAGDSSDNIPGVPGIGPKIAAQLLNEFESLDLLLANAEAIPQKARREKVVQNREKAVLSQRLVTLERSIPLGNMTFPEEANGVADLRMKPMDSDRLLKFFEEMGFRDLKRRFQDRLTQQKRAKKSRKTKYNKRPKATIPEPEHYEELPF